jgi:hypothetical protein
VINEAITRQHMLNPYILVGDNLDILNVASGFKNLSQNILGNPLVKTTDV